MKSLSVLQMHVHSTNTIMLSKWKYRVVSLVRLRQYIHYLTEHAALCGVPITFLGESLRRGLAWASISVDFTVFLSVI